MRHVNAFFRLFRAVLVLTFLFIPFVLASPAGAVEKSKLDAMSLQALNGKAPQVTVMNGSKEVRLEDFRGKVVMLHFWGQCRSCMQELPTLESLYREFNGKGLVLLSINIEPDVSQKEMDALSKKLGVTYPTYLVKKGMVPESYWESGEPQTYFVDGKGNFIGRAFGARDWKSKEAFSLVKALLEKK